MRYSKHISIFLALLILFSAVFSSVAFASNENNPNKAKIDKLNAKMFVNEEKLYFSLDQAEERAERKFGMKCVRFEEKMDRMGYKEEIRQIKAAAKIDSITDPTKKADAISKETAKAKKISDSMVQKENNFYAKIGLALRKFEDKLIKKINTFYTKWDKQLAKLGGGSYGDYILIPKSGESNYDPKITEDIKNPSEDKVDMTEEENKEEENVNGKNEISTDD